MLVWWEEVISEWILLKEVTTYSINGCFWLECIEAMWMQESNDNNFWSTREVLKKIPMENILGEPILGSENEKKIK